MRLLVATATFNESGNVEELIAEINQHLPNQDILIIDDNSPDGTGELLDRIAKKNKFLKVIHREGKLGLGTAHIALMRYALERNYDALITMDADLSHEPKVLPQLISLLSEYEFVQGSRFCEGGKNNLSFGRKVISRTANILARVMAGLKLKETTNSLRGYRRELLEKLPLERIRSNGYSFFVESQFYVSRIGATMSEFPIEFMVRNAGESKISRTEIIKSVLMLFSLLKRRLFEKA
jgi:dolichol-phosphate mannosyltransferase